MPSPVLPVQAPAGYIPQYAIAFGARGGESTAVASANPLPTTPALAAALSTPLSGTTASSAVIGAFVPQLARPIWLTVSGSWTGTVQVQRSTDAGATRVALTVAGQSWATFAANCNEPIGEETVSGASYYLAVTLTGGALSYGMYQ